MCVCVDKRASRRQITTCVRLKKDLRQRLLCTDFFLSISSKSPPHPPFLQTLCRCSSTHSKNAVAALSQVSAKSLLLYGTTGSARGLVCRYSIDRCMAIFILIKYHLGIHLVFKELMGCGNCSRAVTSLEQALALRRRASPLLSPSA